LAAICLDDETGFDAGEIGDVWRDRVLPSEAPAKPVIPHSAPQDSLGVG
jgi:hypothetical protein